MNNQVLTESQIRASVSNDTVLRGEPITYTETTLVGWPFSCFISHALAGTYQTAERYRPKYIELFTEKDSIETSISGRILNNTTVRIGKQQSADDESEEANKDFYQATLHFRIPYSYFTEENATVTCLKLFCEAENDPCAVIKLNGTTLPEIEKNYNLYIDWTIRLKGDNNG